MTSIAYICFIWTLLSRSRNNHNTSHNLMKEKYSSKLYDKTSRKNMKIMQNLDRLLHCNRSLNEHRRLVIDCTNNHLANISTLEFNKTFDLMSRFWQKVVYFNVRHSKPDVIYCTVLFYGELKICPCLRVNNKFKMKHRNTVALYPIKVFTYTCFIHM